MTDTPPPGDDLWDTIPDNASAITRMQPHDITAEMSVLGACCFSRDAVRILINTLDPAAYYVPAHALIHQAIVRMHGAGQAIDPITLSKHLEDSGDLTRAGGRAYVFQLADYRTAIVAHAVEYAEIVQDRSLRRALIAIGTRLVEMGFNPEDPTADLVERAVTLTRELRDQGTATIDDHVPNIDEFLSVEQTHDWLVPGLLERRDRIVFTGAEGAGKSVLSRQMAMCISAGLHPFTHAPIETGPGTVLVFDCENGEFASGRHYRPLRQLAQRHTHGAYDPNRLRILCRPEGLDLTRPADRSFVMRKVEKLQPDFMVIGPIYRLHAGDPNSEELARKVSVVIDEARATSGCAVWMEAHAPHQNGFSNQRALRPLGSSLWMRWPEFGYGIRLADDDMAKKERLMNVVSWRGPREERSWPVQIKQGADWPWVRYDPHAGSGWGAA